MQESALGRLIADSYRYEAQTDIALMNGGGIRTSIDAGDITLQDLLSVLPFNNTVVRIDLTGAEIRTALEHGLSQYPDANGAFIHGSGFTYSYDLSAPVGSRVVDIWIAETLIDPQATYSLALLNFLATGVMALPCSISQLLVNSLAMRTFLFVTSKPTPKRHLP